MPGSESLVPEIFNVPLTSADTEYKQAVSINTKHFSIQCRTAFDVRYAFTTGKVASPTAPYATIKSGIWYNTPEKLGVQLWDQYGVTAVSEVNTVTIALTWAQNDIINLRINGRQIVVTVGTLITTAQVATTLKQAWNGEAFTDGAASVSPTGGGPVMPDHSQLTATVSGSVVTLTADSIGVRWNENAVMVAAETTAGNGTATLANATPAAGPTPYIYLASAEAGVVVEIIAWKALR